MDGVSRTFVSVPAGTIHVAQAGTGRPVLLLHQTPRSWDEYRDVVPILGVQFHAIAMDTLGFGDSSKPRGPDTIELWAEVAVSLLDVLDIDRASVVGHHTGAAIAIELAASFPARVDKLVLSAPPFVDEDHRRLYGEKPPVDEVERKLDGSHLGALWALRAPFYPKRIDLLDRFIVDALKAGERAAGGHVTVARYEMEPKLELVTAPTLIIRPTDDPFAGPDATKLAARLPRARLADLPGGMIPAPDQLPDEFARLVMEFLDE
jgi:pimeloyl-ACP methyl ester carboxylesterase